MLLDRSPTLPSLLLLLLLLAPDCQGNSGGAPAQACGNLTPNHGPAPQPADEFPYQLEMTPTSVRPGDRVTLTISTPNGGTTPFKGFFVQARNAQSPDSTVALGQFVDIDPLHKPVDCGSTASGITHSSSASKSAESVTWQAPDALDSDVIFLVTVVQERTIFWAGVRSESITLTREPMEEPTAEPSPEPTAEPSPEPTAEPTAEPEPTKVDDAMDKNRSAGSSVYAGAALLLAPLAMAAFHRLQ